MYDRYGYEKVIMVDKNDKIITENISSDDDIIVNNPLIEGWRNIPFKNNYNLYDYQIDTIKWMKEREKNKSFNGIKGGILCLEMGLGKTLISVGHVLTSPKEEWPCLVVVSKTLLNEWKIACIEKFFPIGSVKVLYLHKDFMCDEKNDKIKIKDINRDYIKTRDFVITTYEVCSSVCKANGFYEQILTRGAENTLMKDKIVCINSRTRLQADIPKATGLQVIYGIPWSRVICDESQRFVDPKTFTYKCMMTLYGDNKWCLTGTPIRNKVVDLWSQIRFLGYSLIDTVKDWKWKWYDSMTSHKIYNHIYNLTYKDVNIKMPDKKANDIRVDMDCKQKQFYDGIYYKTVEAFKLFKNGKNSFASVLAMFVRLRQVCISPYLLVEDEKREDVGIGIKINTVLEIIKNIPKNEKYILFSSFSSGLDVIMEEIKNKIPDSTFVKIDKSVIGKNRFEVLNNFRNKNGPQGLFITYKVGSEGLNLTEANHCICMEPWWNTSVNNQAIARAWRIGQEKSVNIYNIIANSSIEDRVLEVCRKKIDITNDILDCSRKKKIHEDENEGLNAEMIEKILLG